MLNYGRTRLYPAKAIVGKRIEEGIFHIFLPRLVRGVSNYVV